MQGKPESFCTTPSALAQTVLEVTCRQPGALSFAVELLPLGEVR